MNKIKGEKLIVLCMAFVLCFDLFHAEDAKTSMQQSVIGTALSLGEYESAYNMIMGCPSVYTQEQYASILTYYPNFAPYYEQLQSAGIAPAPNVSTNDTATNVVTQPASTPPTFTVETYSLTKTMWATQQVNTRQGASTEYSKVGSLKQYEQVNVTGVASTGWYQITKEDGTIVYVSNKYLSEENPSDRVVYDYNEKTEKVDTYTFTDTEPEVIDEKVKEIKATPIPTVKPTPIPTITPTIAPTVAPTATPVAAEQVMVFGIIPYSTWLIAMIVLSIVVISVSIFFIVRYNKKNRRK